MKHIKTSNLYNKTNKKILESNSEEPIDPFAELYELSASFTYNLSMFKKKYEKNLSVNFSEEADLNEHIYEQINDIVTNILLLNESVLGLRAELKM